MSPDLAFWLTLAVKMSVTAAFVVLATWAAERAGVLLGAMVATLPISAGPAYVFLALDHDAAFISASALASLASNAANVIFCIVYSLLAQSRGLVVSVSAALASWVVLAVLLRTIDWSLPGAVFFNLVVFMICLPIAHRFASRKMPPTTRRWYDVALRAGMVTILVAAVVMLSSQVGPTVTGILTLFPIVLIGLMLIFQPRIGGPATAALMANAIGGLVGYGAALIALNLAVVPLGVPTALTLALAISIGWNLIVFGVRRRYAPQADAQGHNRPGAV